MGFNEKVLRGTIATHSSVIAVYDSYIRVFSPHCIGTGIRKADHKRVKRIMAFQFGGSGHSKKPLGWRCFEVSRLRFVIPCPWAGWHTSEIGDRGNNGCIDRIELEA